MPQEETKKTFTGFGDLQKLDLRLNQDSEELMYFGLSVYGASATCAS